MCANPHAFVTSTRQIRCLLQAIKAALIRRFAAKGNHSFSSRPRDEGGVTSKLRAHHPPIMPNLSRCLAGPDAVHDEPSTREAHLSFSNQAISCLRCNSLCLRCTLPRPDSSRRTNAVCNHCHAANSPHCFFLPQIRGLHSGCNSRCVPCSISGSRCKFTNPNDNHCVRCSKQHLDCVFKLTGKTSV